MTISDEKKDFNLHWDLSHSYDYLSVLHCFSTAVSSNFCFKIVIKGNYYGFSELIDFENYVLHRKKNLLISASQV